jgi:hypothetical protein
MPFDSTGFQDDPWALDRKPAQDLNRNNGFTRGSHLAIAFGLLLLLISVPGFYVVFHATRALIH